MLSSCRRARLEDAGPLAELMERTFRQTYQAFNRIGDMDSYVAGAFGIERQQRELTDPAMTTIIAESSGSLVGYAQLRRSEPPSCVPREGPIEIYRFYVQATAHGTGVAQQ